MIIGLTEFPALHQCLQEKNREILYEGKQGIFVRNPKTEISYAYATNRQLAIELFQCTKNNYDDLVIYGNSMKEELYKQTHLQGGEPFYYATYMETVPLNIEESSISYKKLDKTHINKVIQHYSYKECANETYISQCINEGMIGVFVDNELVGFIGIHDSGSIGLLEVVGGYRNHGIGLNLLKRMIQKQRKESKLPFSEIFEHNQISMHLVRKAGMQLSGNTAIWCTRW